MIVYRVTDTQTQEIIGTLGRLPGYFTLPDGGLTLYEAPDQIAPEHAPRWQVRAEEIPDPPAERRKVPKALIVDRLQAVGKLDAARAALDAADLYTRERWNSRDAIYADDETALGLLQAIGADPAVIMA